MSLSILRRSLLALALVAGLAANAAAQPARLQGFPTADAAATALTDAIRRDDDKAVAAMLGAGWRDFYRVPKSTGQVIEIQPSKKRVHRGPAVEVGYTMPDGRAGADVDGYKTMLLEDKDGLARALTEKLLTYATGARVDFADREDVAEIVKSVRTQNYGLRTLIHHVVDSRPFLNK